MEWSTVDEWLTWPYDPYYPYCEEKSAPPAPAQHVPTQAQPFHPDPTYTLLLAPPDPMTPLDMPPKGENPREIRNKAEKQRRDKMKKSIAELAKIVPPVVATGRKMDKTSVLKLTAHYLRAHQYVFGDSINSEHRFSTGTAQALLGFLKGFVLTTTYKGVIVVVSQNVQQYLGYTELELIGKSIFDYTHADDRQMLREQLMPSSNLLGANGELLIPDGPDGTEKVAEALSREKRRFVVRFKKVGQRSDSGQYVTCHVQGTLRKADKASRNSSRCCQMVRRVRARGDNARPCGNDVVFVGLVRPTSETFMNESALESFRMEYRTRHSIDGEIIECESRIALVTGYMTHEVNGVNAMNFMHRDDVRWVIIALREMYDQHRLMGESCYRLMTKNGKFIYMQTRGFLDVDRDSRAVTSFVCTNTVVEENVGKRLIKLMKKKFTLLVNNGEETEIPDDDEDEDTKELPDDQLSPIPVEDPRQLQKVILHLVTNLPSPQPLDSNLANSPSQEDSFPQRLAIIPPRKERIVSAIEKIYSVIKPFKKDPILAMDSKTGEEEMQICTSSDDSGHETPPNTEQPASEAEMQRMKNIFFRRRCRSNTVENYSHDTTPPGRHFVYADRRSSTSRIGSQSRRESYLDSSEPMNDAPVFIPSQYNPQYVHQSTSYYAPSTSMDISMPGSSQYHFNQAMEYSNFGFDIPQRPSEAEGSQYVDESVRFEPMYNPIQLLPSSTPAQQNKNNNFGNSGQLTNSAPIGYYPDLNVNPPNYGSMYMTYQRDQFGNTFPTTNYMAPYQACPHTQTQAPVPSGSGVKRQIDFDEDQGNYKKIAHNLRIIPQIQLNDTAHTLGRFENVTPPPAIETEFSAFEHGAVSTAAPMQAVTTCYANATVSTANATFAVATVERPIIVLIAAANTSPEPKGDDENIPLEPTENEQEENQDPGKIGILESMLDSSCLESNDYSLEDESLEQALGEDFPDLFVSKILAECERMENVETSDNPEQPCN